MSERKAYKPPQYVPNDQSGSSIFSSFDHVGTLDLKQTAGSKLVDSFNEGIVKDFTGSQIHSKLILPEVKIKSSVQSKVEVPKEIYIETKVENLDISKSEPISCHLNRQHVEMSSEKYITYPFVIDFRGTLEDLLKPGGEITKEIDLIDQKHRYLNLVETLMKAERKDAHFKFSPTQLKTMMDNMSIVLKEACLKMSYNNAHVDLHLDNELFIPTVNYSGKMCSLVIYSSREHVKCHEVAKITNKEWNESFDRKLTHIGNIVKENFKYVSDSKEELSGKRGEVGKKRIDKSHPIYYLMQTGDFFPREYTQQHIKNDHISAMNNDYVEWLNKVHEFKKNMPLRETLKFKLSSILDRNQTVEKIYHRTQCVKHGTKNEAYINNCLKEPFECQVTLELTYKFLVPSK